MNLFYKIILITFVLILLISGCTSKFNRKSSATIKEKITIQPPLYILYSKNASREDRVIANDLANYLQKMTGTLISTSQISPEISKNRCVLIGKCAVDQKIIKQNELIDLKRSGCIVRINNKKNIIGLSGRTNVGTMQGGYRLLEDLGVRFLSSSFEYIPSNQPLSFNYTHKKFEPFFDLRFIGTEKQGGNTSLLGDPRKLIKQDEKKYFINLYKDHTQGFLVPTYKYLRKHPEYYARDKDNVITCRSRRSFLGNSTVKTENYANWIWLCMSNTKVREIATKNLLQWMKEQPKCYFFSVMGGDAEWNCECQDCKSIGNLSDNLIDFANFLGDRIKKKHPDTILLVFAYSRTLTAPKTHVAHDNVVILFCPYMPPYFKSSVHSFISSHHNSIGHKSFKQWQQKNSGNMGAFDYNMSFYTPFMDKMITQIKEYATHNMRGVWYCGTASIMPELFIYVNSKLLWKPSLDDDVLIRDFCEKYYAGSGEFMYQFAQKLRAQLRRKNTALSPNLGVLRSKNYYTRIFSREMLLLLKSAEEHAENKICLRKIQAIHLRVLENILFAWKGIDRNATLKDQELFAERLKDFIMLSMTQDDKKKSNSSEAMKKFLWKTGHLKISSPWQKDINVKKLIDNPYKTFKQQHIGWENLQQPVSGGWKIPLDAFTGMLGPIPYRWRCALKNANIIYGKHTAYSKMTGSIFIKDATNRPYTLVIEGQDHDKPLPHTSIQIKINNHVLYEGKNSFVKHGWSSNEYKIPANIIKKGENVISIENLELTDNTVARWLAISDVKLIETKNMQTTTYYIDSILENDNYSETSKIVKKEKKSY